MFGLTKKQIQFAYIAAENPEESATSCAKRAGYSEITASQSAAANMANPSVLQAIQRRREELAAAAGITPELVLREWLSIALADPSELVEVRVLRCVACWAMPDEKLPPNPACASCKGEGVKFVSVKPTAQLSPAARRLYAGAKQTKDGIEVKLRDQSEALRNIADYLGMQNKSKGEISGPGGGPIPLLHATVDDLSDEQLMAIAAAGAASLPVSGCILGVSEGVSQHALPATIEGSAT